MKRMEVRCCCTPNKLLGTLPVQDAARAGDRIKFALMKPRVDFETWRSMSTAPQPREIELPIKTIVHPPGLATRGDSYPAIAAEGVELEQLRRIPGFIENKS